MWRVVVSTDSDVAVVEAGGGSGGHRWPFSGAALRWQVVGTPETTMVVTFEIRPSGHQRGTCESDLLFLC
jgi:hypothetical protein